MPMIRIILCYIKILNKPFLLYSSFNPRYDSEENIGSFRDAFNKDFAASFKDRHPIAGVKSLTCHQYLNTYKTFKA
jgi:hypothetical protein